LLSEICADESPRITDQDELILRGENRPTNEITYLEREASDLIKRLSFVIAFFVNGYEPFFPEEDKTLYCG
jgi:hypothetical protein